MNTLKKAAIKVAVFGLLCLLVAYLFNSRSVLGLNLLFGAVAMTLGAGLAVAGAMANDSGRGGWFIGTFQLLAITYPLTYLLGMVSSVWVLHGDFDNPRELATWLASANGVHLLLIGLVLGIGVATED